MKKLLIFGSVLVAIVLALGIVGFAYAQTPVPPTSPRGGGGMMGGRGMMGGYGRGGMMGGYGQGQMHTYMVAEMAKALEMTVDELNAELAAGKTMGQVAEAKGISAEEFKTLMTNARNAALKQMVADGVITQAQADWMAIRMQNMPGFGAGGAGCPMHGGYGAGSGRWNSQPSTGSSGL